ncbi:TetR/AcrR family transcriptional regulator [Haliea sp. E17]|uniref:TetR/AcrR family transcriptional regulator n=1 Tax=Haliea sp. E17 TaxID=3401576 RepID=UPI003AAD3013
MNRDSPSSAPGNLQDAILDATETLIGRHGSDGVSLRQISLAAGSANNSAVHYYFKNKDGLIRETIRRRSSSVDQRRRDVLGKLLKKGFEKDTRAIMEVLLRPIADETNKEGECSYAAFLLALRVFNDISYWRTIADSPEITRNLYEMLQDSLQPVPAEIVELRFLTAFSLFLMSVVDWDQSRSFSRNLISSREAYLQHSLDFATAGMQAPWSP